MNENENKTHSKLWHTMKESSRQCLYEKLEKCHISNLILHLNALAQKEEITLKGTRRQERIKMRAEFNKIDAKRTIFKKSTKGMVLWENQQDRQMST